MGSIPRCGLLKTPAVNTFVLMLMANLDDCRLALIPKHHLGQNNWSGCTSSLSCERILPSVRLFHADCTLASVLRSAGLCADVLRRIFAVGWLKICRSCLWWWPRCRGSKVGDGLIKAGEGGKLFLLIPLNRENVPAPFAKLTSTELRFLFYLLRCNEPPTAAVDFLSCTSYWG